MDREEFKKQAEKLRSKMNKKPVVINTVGYIRVEKPTPKKIEPKSESSALIQLRRDKAKQILNQRIQLLENKKSKSSNNPNPSGGCSGCQRKK